MGAPAPKPAGGKAWKVDSDDSALQWQFAKGAGMALLGGVSAAAGGSASLTGGGAVVGVPMALTGGSDAVQGATMAWDAINGKESNGYNPGKAVGQGIFGPKWGAMAYDAFDLGAGLLSLRRLVPAVVDPAVTGISRTKPIFGVKVPKGDRAFSLGGKVIDSPFVKPALLGLATIPKIYNAYQDYPRRGQGSEK